MVEKWMPLAVVTCARPSCGYQIAWLTDLLHIARVVRCTVSCAQGDAAHCDIVRVAFKASSMAERERSSTCRCRPEPPCAVGSKSFSPRFGITGRATLSPLLAYVQKG